MRPRFANSSGFPPDSLALMRKRNGNLRLRNGLISVEDKGKSDRSCPLPPRREPSPCSALRLSQLR